MPADIDIVIVNWNAGDLLRDCILSVLETGGNLVGRIIVVDNGSTDQSLRKLPEDPRILIIEAQENLGFARACNRGASMADGRFILFLNPDTRLYPTTLANVRDFMDSAAGRRIGVCGIRLIEDDGSVQLHTTEFPTPFNIFKVDDFRSKFDHMTNRYVSHVIGAFYFIRREIFDHLNGFDERFFVYFEDLDLSFRVREAGKDIFYLASTQAYHKGGGTSDSIKARRLFYSQSSRLLYSQKHFSWLGHLAVLTITLCVEPGLRLIRACVHRSPAQMRETLGAYRLLISRESPLWASKSR